MWRGRAKRLKWVARWNDTEAKMTSVCAWVCVCVWCHCKCDTQPFPQWRTVHLRSTWLNIIKRWLLFGLLLTALWKCLHANICLKGSCVCKCASVAPPPPEGAQRMCATEWRGNKRGEDAFQWLPLLPLRRLITCWDGCMKKRNGNQTRNNESDNKEKVRVDKKQGNIIVGPPVGL